MSRRRHVGRQLLGDAPVVRSRDTEACRRSIYKTRPAELVILIRVVVGNVSNSNFDVDVDHYVFSFSAIRSLSCTPTVDMGCWGVTETASTRFLQLNQIT